MTVLCQLNQCSKVWGLLLFLRFLFDYLFCFWQTGFCVVFGVVMEGHILRNVSTSDCTIAWTLVLFHKWRQIWCPWRMWCYGNTITHLLFHLLNVMSLVTISLLHQQVFIQYLCVWKCIEKEKKYMQIHFQQSLQFPPKISF